MIIIHAWDWFLLQVDVSVVRFPSLRSQPTLFVFFSKVVSRPNGGPIVGPGAGCVSNILSPYNTPTHHRDPPPAVRNQSELSWWRRTSCIKTPMQAFASLHEPQLDALQCPATYTLFTYTAGY